MNTRKRGESWQEALKSGRKRINYCKEGDPEEEGGEDRNQTRKRTRTDSVDLDPGKSSAVSERKVLLLDASLRMKTKEQSWCEDPVKEGSG